MECWKVAVFTGTYSWVLSMFDFSGLLNHQRLKSISEILALLFCEAQIRACSVRWNRLEPHCRLWSCLQWRLFNLIFSAHMVPPSSETQDMYFPFWWAALSFWDCLWRASLSFGALTLPCKIWKTKHWDVFLFLNQYLLLQVTWVLHKRLFLPVHNGLWDFLAGC